MRIVNRLFVLVFCLGISTSISAKKSGSIKIGMCSDVHLPTMHDAEYRITKFIDSMKIAKPDFIIELGDFGTPKENCAPYFKIWDSFPGDKYHVIGNHEMDGGTSHEEALQYRNLKTGYYSFEKNGFHFIVLDGNDKNDPAARGYKQFVGPAQVNWLKNELATTKFPVIIFSHQGLAYYRSADEEYGVVNYKQMQALLEEHNAKNPSKKVIACFNGHTHYDYAENIKGIWYITITSMSYHWLGEKYAHLQYGEEVDKNYKWIKYTAPFKEPLFTIVEISTQGTIKIEGKKSEWVGKTPWEVGYPESQKIYMRPSISKRNLKFTLK